MNLIFFDDELKKDTISKIFTDPVRGMNDHSESKYASLTTVVSNALTSGFFNSWSRYKISDVCEICVIWIVIFNLQTA